MKLHFGVELLEQLEGSMFQGSCNRKIKTVLPHFYTICDSILNKKKVDGGGMIYNMLRVSNDVSQYFQVLV